MKLGIIINSIALLASVGWTIYKPDFEPIIVMLTLIATLIGQVAYNSKQKKIKMTQKSGDNSTNIQIGEINNKY